MSTIGIGDRIRLIHMQNDPSPIPDGATGTVTRIANGQVSVDWDEPNEGRGLMLLEGVDMFERIVEIVVGDVYRVAGYDGIAFRCDGYELIRDEDYEWSGIEYEDRDHVMMHMVGDDRPYRVEACDLTPLSEDEYCDGCGQIGCGWHS